MPSGADVAPHVGDLAVEKEMPEALRRHLTDLSCWASENLKESRRDLFRLWLLKGPAIVASASAGILTFKEANAYAPLVGAVGSLCVLLDGVFPAGERRNIHLRAHHDIQQLQQTAIARWRRGYLRGKEPKDLDQLAADIIHEAEIEMKRIAAYVRDAETKLPERR
jgi:hypothetical protein